MAMFELAFPTILRHEGGYVNNPSDPGGETKYGISKRSYPNLDIFNLTTAQAAALYKHDFWDRYSYGDIIPQAVATKVFDMAVNMGATRAHKIVQQALGLPADGQLGPQTLNGLNTSNSLTLIVSLQNTQAAFYRALVDADSTKAQFLKGWLNRAYDRV